MSVHDCHPPLITCQVRQKPNRRRVEVLLPRLELSLLPTWLKEANLVGFGAPWVVRRNMPRSQD